MLTRNLLLLICIVLLAVGCGNGPEISFSVNDGVALGLKKSAKKASDGGRRISYQLERPVTPVGEDPGLSIGLTDFNEPVVVSLEYQGEVTSEVTLHPLPIGGQIRYQYPLATIDKIDGFSIEVSKNDSDTGLISAGIQPMVTGIQYGDLVTVDSRLGLSVTKGNPHTTYSFDVSKLVRSGKGGLSFRIAYTYDGVFTTRRPVKITASSSPPDRGIVEYGLRPKSGSTQVYLYEAAIGFIPDTIEITVEGSGFRLDAMTTEKLPGLYNNRGIPVPHPIDLGSLVESKGESWQRDDYDLYRWNLYSDILIMDTASYEVQSGFFKRLAFFVEKAGSAGTLVSDAFLAGKHGWNAHDYQAEDLARFYNRASSEGFALGELEIHLREILLENGIIGIDRGAYVPIVGGIISLSQESSPRLRNLFMTHEGYHGIFFSDGRYRDASFVAWQALSPLEKSFWREFLLLNNYNIRDEFLVVNEFQAYLMQISADRLDAYFWDYKVPGLAELVPRTRQLVDELRQFHPDTFHRSAAEVEKALKKFSGIGAEDLFCLQEIE